MFKKIIAAKKSGVWYLHPRSKLIKQIIKLALLLTVFYVFAMCFNYFANFSSKIFGSESLPVQTSVQVPIAYALETAPPYTIAIDAGHGGMDTGAKAVVDEVVVCDLTTEYLYRLLEKDPNYTPILTHQTGIDASTTDRANEAIRQRASLLLSIHANYDSSSSQSHGFECFPTPPGREYSEQSLKFALLIAEGMGDAGHRLRGENGVKYMYYINGSSTKKSVDSSDTTVRDDQSFGMVEKPLCPAVLVEQCFLSNENDYYNWATDEGCERAAIIYYNAICAYFSTQPI